MQFQIKIKRLKLIFLIKQVFIIKPSVFFVALESLQRDVYFDMLPQQSF